MKILLIITIRKFDEVLVQSKTLDTINDRFNDIIS